MTKNRLRIWPLYSLLLVFMLLAAGFGFVVYEAHQEESPVTVAVAPAVTTRAVPVVSPDDVGEVDPATIPAVELYPNTKNMLIKDVAVKASVAQTWPERIQGLSDTPYLPADVVKFFVFDSPGMHSIWMKDMNYSIDILWVDEAGVIVHIEEDASPESYPAMFLPKLEALYVIEAVAGFVAEHGIAEGDTVLLPTL